MNIFLKKNLHQSKVILYICTQKCGSSSVGRAPAFQAGCREFEPRLPLFQNLNQTIWVFLCFLAAPFSHRFTDFYKKYSDQTLFNH